MHGESLLVMDSVLKSRWNTHLLSNDNSKEQSRVQKCINTQIYIQFAVTFIWEFIGTIYALRYKKK